MNLRQTRGTILCLIALVLGHLGSAPSAWAVQQHGGAEGFVSHQLGHVLFFSGMTYLLLRLRRAKSQGPGWKEFKGFLILIILWNVLTFTGHWMMETVDHAKFIVAEHHTVAFRVTGFTDAVFYFSRLDHLVLVPSFACLLFALRRWRES